VSLNTHAARNRAPQLHRHTCASAWTRRSVLKTRPRWCRVARASPPPLPPPRSRSVKMGDNQSGGISKLLAAEHEATEIVNKARKGARSRVAAAPEAPPAASQPLATGRHRVCAAAVALAVPRPRRSCSMRDPECAAVPSLGGHATRVALRSPALAGPRRACVVPRRCALPRHAQRSLPPHPARESQSHGF
jgi:hypothetical protein